MFASKWQMFRITTHNTVLFSTKVPVQVGMGLTASAAHPRPTQIQVTPSPRGCL